MEFIDPVPESKPEVEVKAPENTQTEETVQLLESEIDKAYTTVEHKFQELWQNASKNASGLQEKYHLEEHRKQLIEQLNQAKENIGAGVPVEKLNLDLDFDKIKTSANSALDSLDQTLEQVEKQAGQYVSSFASFFSNIVSIAPKEVEEEKEEVLFSLNDSYGTSRYDNELFKLHTTPGFYIDEKSDDAKKFNADSRTKEISELLQKYPNTLTKLMNDLVPVKIPYNEFWYWYFNHDNKFKESENKRKQLLEKKEAGTSNAGDEEDFTWDDEEEEQDEEEAVDVGKEVKKQKEEVDKDDDWE